ncbi:amidase [Pararhodobacter oceanensis]|uniref:amidase n=1 Tax=Pararhodobacter oceanensis TaxID=2172121 RepID=UPI003A8F92AF
MSDNWRKLSAADLGRGIEGGSICPVALTEGFLDAIDKHPLAPRIYARTMRQQAEDAAMAARRRARAGRRLGPLDGVPVSWKDLFDTAGVATEAGSQLLKDRVPAQDAVVVTRLTEAGLPPLGKTHMTELAFSGLGLNPSTETSPCIHDPARVSGGSSSGAAASVAFDLAPLAIGSDTGGSVRVPAVWNDLVGLKTTSGRVPLDGAVPLAARFDTIGPLARSVEDAALAFALLDASPAPDLRGASLHGTRLLVLDGLAFDDLAPEAAQGFERALSRLSAAGAQITHGSLPCTEAAMPLSGILYTSECYGTWGKTIEANPDVMYAPVRDRFRAGANRNAADFVAAWHQLDAMRRDYLSATAGYDAVLIPSAANLPPKIDDLLANETYFAAENLKALRNSRIGNLMGLCALTLPSGTPMTGVMMMAAPMAETQLLRLGAAAEQALA